MSGVFGVIDFSVQTSVKGSLDRMSLALNHRDWYVIETYLDDQNGLGLGRVGIGVFNAAPQPVWDPTGKVAILMAGEIYNADRLKAGLPAEWTWVGSDETLLLALYRQYGVQSLRDLDGQFVFAIWDSSQRRLVLANDRFGIYPTYIASVGNRFIFAPEVKAVLTDPSVDRSLRNDALAEYFRFQHFLGDKTFFRGVTMLPPASFLVLDAQVLSSRVEQYWGMEEIAPVPQDITFEQAVEEGTRLFRNAVHKMSQGPGRVGVFLSGGLDGRSILGFTPSNSGKTHTFTFGQPGCVDEVFAAQIARAAGTQHYYYPYRDGNWISEQADFHVKVSEGFHSWLHMHGIQMLPNVRQYIDVNLSGLGDLLWHQSNFAPLSLLKAPDDLAFTSSLFELYSQKYTWPGITYAEERLFYTPSYAKALDGLAFDSFATEVQKYAHMPYPLRLAGFNLLNHFTRYLGYAGVFGRSHLEYRFPYFDLELLSFCFGLPYEHAEDRRLQKAIIAREMPALARIPYAEDELPVSSGRAARLVARSIQKVKRGIHQNILPVFPPRSSLYADYENWLRSDLRPWAENILFSERTLDRGIVRPDAIRSLWERHQNGYESWTIGKIASMITFEMAMRYLLD